MSIFRHEMEESPASCYITIFGRRACAHCKKVKTILGEVAAYTFIDLDRFPEKRADMVSLTGKHTVPQVFFNNYHIGDAQQIQSYDDKRLKALFQYFSKEQDFATRAENPELLQTITSSEEIKETTTDTTHSSKTVESTSLGLDSRLQNHAGTLEDDVILDLSLDTLFPPIVITAADGKSKALSFLSVLITLQTELPLFRQSVKIFKLENSCFYARDACYILQKVFSLNSAEESVLLGQALVNLKVIAGVGHRNKFNDSKLIFKLSYVDISPRPTLNNSITYEWPSHVVDCGNVTKILEYNLSKCEDRHTNSTTGLIDYITFAEDKDYQSFHIATCALQRIDWNQLKDQDVKKAFFINTYNILTKHAFVEKGIPKSNLNRAKYFSTFGYDLGGVFFSFSAIENGILRGNKRAPYTFSKPIPPNDPRNTLIFSKCDCRIHFALNCGAASCPPVKTYNAGSINV
ncbi:hypothetical protein IE077_002768 [Cardiosporidium cionae]|uniref:Glutaredoxin domain-containing protein n=1 Tax=Cardiosporidium cionae TaxID=476202 RepID=A0ABQ7JA12_9APIC|nr:hypothetical protein IE077_002768 [Cardiosporidium cionae]|eukprot:KAF8820824.1 hypothetical protein IE077_002768 [Cardiosporidium cionae]